MMTLRQVKALVYRKFARTATHAAVGWRRTLFVAFAISLSAPPVQALSVAELACGATVCLAGDGGAACAPYLKHYYAINGPTKHITQQLRKAFLAHCKPVNAPSEQAFLAQYRDVHAQRERDLQAAVAAHKTFIENIGHERVE